ncbi:Tetratricopeptide repeat protein [Gimesia panareensis]|uniref:Tetratricopeptide repeat protein n=1 Tax=Gimesia panareensis TaxID=2527978 RepID=A0A518FX58_9PLAN|nr:tetratricopeptide repeat protein [Gimesia panareensis]QDV20968.1 Tetratricopeptide repeat protein [Gimesia panareensis]
MTDAEPIQETAPQETKKKRSPVERAVVWGLIAVILLVVLNEWGSRSGYDSTLAALQKRIALSDQGDGNDFSIAEAKALVKGFPYGEERLTKSGKELQYRWLSLFRTYAIQLSLANDGEILSLKTDVEPFGAEQAKKAPQIAAQQLSLPEKGLSEEYQDVVVLTTDQIDSQADGLKGMLVREIVRQALLIGGRDGLGLQTRDGSLRGEVLLIDQPELFPLQLATHINRDREVDIDLIRPLKDAQPVRWKSERFTLPEEGAFETLIEKSEALSRGEFVEGLKTMGYSGSAPQWQEKSTIPDETLQKLNEWNFITQYTAIQNLHKAIAEEGESPERLGALVRAYANLGSLTDYLWSPAHKVFKARALLYAERLKARTDSSPWALAHRAYARTFAGRHQSALVDLETIRSKNQQTDGQQRPLPEWVEVLEAYCSYQPDLLEQAAENDQTRNLAVYLRCLLADPVLDKKQMLASTEQMLKLEPACCQVVDRLCQVRALGVQRMATEHRLDELWPKLHQKLLESNMGTPLKGTIQRYLSALDALTSEEKTRLTVIKFLKDTQPNEIEPSLNGLGQLLQDVSFIHVYRKLSVQTGSLGIPADADELTDYLKLVKGHPYEQVIASFTSDQPQAKIAYEKLMQTYDPCELELNAFPLIKNASYKLSPNAFNQLYREAGENADFVYEDQLQRMRCLQQLLSETRQEQNSEFAEILMKVSPHMPQTVILNIKTDKEYFENHKAELMERYGKSPEVLTAVANRYLADQNDTQAEEVLKRRIEIAPDHETYTSLANLYYNRGEKEKWKETLETALELTSLGLENASIRSKLAYYHMHRGEWEQAKPLAVQAAMSYSAWGLLTAAYCYEGLGELEQAEQYHRACSMQYAGSATGWYFFCVRTGYGDIDSARQVAEQRLLANPSTTDFYLTMELGVFQLTQGLKSKAFDTLLATYQKHNDGYCGLLAALIADDLELHDERDDLLKQIAGMWNQDFGKAELANIFQTLLQNPDQMEWNANRFQSLLVQIQDGSPTNFYYFAGKFLEQHGQEKWANIYLQSAATSSATNKYNCMLAAQHLRSKNIEIHDRRTTELDAGYAAARQQLQQVTRLLQKGKPQEAIDICDAVLKSKPELIAALMSRGQAHEALKNDKAALADYQRALEIDPDYWLAHNNLTYIYAASEQEEFRDKAAALQHAQRAFDLQPTKFWGNYSAMAVAYAANGQFEKAIEMQNQVLRLGPESQRLETVRRLSLFREGKPYLRSAEK